MMQSADQSIHCKTVHPLNVILILNMEMDAVVLVDGVGIRRIIVHVAVVLITEYKVNFEEKISKTRFGWNQNFMSTHLFFKILLHVIFDPVFLNE